MLNKLTLPINSLGYKCLSKYPVAVLLILFAAQVFNHDRGGKITGLMILLFIPSLLIPAQRAWSTVEKKWVLLCLLFFIACIPAYLISENHWKAGSEGERLIKYLFLPAVSLVMLHRSSFTVQHFLIGVVGLSWLAFFMAGYDHFMGHARHEQIHGDKICSGNIRALIGVLLISLLPLYKRKWFVLLSFIVVILAMLKTETRGAWLAVFGLLPLIAAINIQSDKGLSKNKKILAVLACLVFIVGIGSTPLVQSNIKRAYSNVSSYIESPQENGNTSLGIRFELYRASIAIAQDYPWFGVGLGGVTGKIAEYDRYGLIIQHFGASSNPSMHNEFLHVLVTKGILALLIFLILNVFLLHYFYTKYRKNSSNDLIKYLGISGLYFNLAVIIEGLSIPFLTGHNGIFIFIMTNTVFIYFLENANVESLKQVKEENRVCK